MVKELKRLLCIILILSFAVIPVFADDKTDTEAQEITKTDTELQTATELLEALNVITEADGFDAEGDITRGYFTALVSRAMKVDFGGDDIRTIFRDVAQDYKYAGEIAGMYRMGYVKGDTDRFFYPENKITYNEAVTILINSLGFSARAEARGGWPSGYAAEAKRIGLSADKTGGTLTQGESVRLIYEMLESEAAIAEGIQDGETVYSVEKDLLAKIHKVYRAEGIVTENGITGLNYAQADEDSICVDGFRIKNTEDKDFSGLIGMYEKVYYRDNDGTAEYLLACDENRNTVYNLTGFNDDVSYNRSANSIMFDDGRKKGKTSINLASDFKLIYNGKAEDNYLKYLSDLSESSIRIIENDGDGLYDAVIVENYTIMVADSINTDTETIVDLYDSSMAARLDGIKTVKYLNADGDKINLSDIAKNDVVCWYVSNNKEYARVIKSGKSVSGMIASMIPSEEEYIIDGKEYKAAPAVKKGAVKLEVGKSGTFGLDIFGRIASFREDKSSGEGFGLLIDYKKEGVFDGVIKVRLLSEYHDIRTYELSNNVQIDDVRYKSEKVFDVLSAKASANDTSEGRKEDLVKYKVNNDDKIDSIEFALCEPPAKSAVEDGKLYMYKTKKQRFYKANTGNFNDEYIIDKTSTVVFGISTNFDYGDEDRYFVMSGSKFVNDSWPVTEAYTTKKEPDKAEAVIYYGNQPSGGVKFLAINSLSESVDAEDNMVYTAKGFTQNSEAEVTISSELVSKLNLTVGDIIGVSSNVNSKGTIVDTKLIYDWSEDKMVTDGINNAIYDERAYMIYPYSYSGSVIKWIKSAGYDEAKAAYSNKNITENDLNNTTVSENNVYIADGNGRGDIYRKGTMADIIGYTQNPESFSKIIVRSLWGDTQRVFVFNR